MRTLIYLLRKEFLQIRRNRMIMAIMLVMPVIQLIILANAADYEIRNVKLHVIDNDQSSISKSLTFRFEASPYFTLESTGVSQGPAIELLKSNKADLILDIPVSFSRDLVSGEGPSLRLLVNAINGSKAGLSVNYASAIIEDFSQERHANVQVLPVEASSGKIVYSSAFLFNRDLDYEAFMVPGIIVILVTMVGMFLSALNIVREKEIGTIEQINVSPIKKSTFIAGKLIPFWIIGLVVLTVGLLVARYIFGISVVHALAPIYTFSAIFLVLVLGLGLIVSNMSDNQQQAMLITYFFMMIFILMGGLFTPIESMPHWAQVVTYFNPVAYFIKVMRMVILKGSTMYDIAHYLYGFAAASAVVMAVASYTYRKRAS